MHGQLLVLLSDTLLPLFIFNNGMNLISKPLIIPNNQAILAYAYVFGDFVKLQVFRAILEQKR